MSNARSMMVVDDGGLKNAAKRYLAAFRRHQEARTVAAAYALENLDAIRRQTVDPDGSEPMNTLRKAAVDLDEVQVQLAGAALMWAEREEEADRENRKVR